MPPKTAGILKGLHTDTATGRVRLVFCVGLVVFVARCAFRYREITQQPSVAIGVAFAELAATARFWMGVEFFAWLERSKRR
jgi:hypothetical protein